MALSMMQRIRLGDHEFHMASGNELVIYELHIGTLQTSKKKGHPVRSIVDRKVFLSQ